MCRVRGVVWFFFDLYWFSLILIDFYRFVLFFRCFSLIFHFYGFSLILIIFSLFFLWIYWLCLIFLWVVSLISENCSHICSSRNSPQLLGGAVRPIQLSIHHCVRASRSKIQVAGEFLKSKIRAFFLKFLFYYTTLGECTPDPHLDSRHLCERNCHGLTCKIFFKKLNFFQAIFALAQNEAQGSAV